MYIIIQYSTVQYRTVHICKYQVKTVKNTKLNLNLKYMLYTPLNDGLSFRMIIQCCSVLGIFPTAFSKGRLAKGQFSKWQLPKWAIFQAATSQRLGQALCCATGCIRERVLWLEQARGQALLLGCTWEVVTLGKLLLPVNKKNDSLIYQAQGQGGVCLQGPGALSPPIRPWLPTTHCKLHVLGSYSGSGITACPSTRIDRQ